MDASSTGVLQSVVRLHWLALRQHGRIHLQNTMDELITYLQRFAECYKDDPEGLADDFRLVVGYSFDELCDKLNDEIVEHGSN